MATLTQTTDAAILTLADCGGSATLSETKEGTIAIEEREEAEGSDSIYGSEGLPDRYMSLSPSPPPPVWPPLSQTMGTARGVSKDIGGTQGGESAAATNKPVHGAQAVGGAMASTTMGTMGAEDSESATAITTPVHVAQPMVVGATATKGVEGESANAITPPTHKNGRVSKHCTIRPNTPICFDAAKHTPIHPQIDDAITTPVYKYGRETKQHRATPYPLPHCANRLNTPIVSPRAAKQIPIPSQSAAVITPRSHMDKQHRACRPKEDVATKQHRDNHSNTPIISPGATKQNPTLSQAVATISEQVHKDGGAPKQHRANRHTETPMSPYAARQIPIPPQIAAAIHPQVHKDSRASKQHRASHPNTPISHYAAKRTPIPPQTAVANTPRVHNDRRASKQHRVSRPNTLVSPYSAKQTHIHPQTPASIIPPVYKDGGSTKKHHTNPYALPHRANHSDTPIISPGAAKHTQNVKSTSPTANSTIRHSTVDGPIKLRASVNMKRQLATKHPDPTSKRTKQNPTVPIAKKKQRKQIKLMTVKPKSSRSRSKTLVSCNPGPSGTSSKSSLVQQQFG